MATIKTSLNRQPFLSETGVIEHNAVCYFSSGFVVLAGSHVSGTKNGSNFLLTTPNQASEPYLRGFQAQVMTPTGLLYGTHLNPQRIETSTSGTVLVMNINSGSAPAAITTPAVSFTASINWSFK